MRKIVAIDLGSNTLRAVLYDCQKDQIIQSYEKTVRLAQDLAQTQIISQAATQRLIDAIEQMPQIFKNYPIKAVTTQAVRLAKNKKEFLQYIRRQTQIRFEIIDGKKEGALTAKAVKRRLEVLGYKASDFVVVDIGGGSTEVVFVDEENIGVKSFAIGIVTATQKGFASLDAEFAKVKRFCAGKSFGLFVSTAGTPTTVAAMKLGIQYDAYDAAKINGTILQKKDLDAAKQTLLSLDKTRRERLVGVLRDDLIVTGIAIYKEFFKILNVTQSVVIDDGLREGVALEFCEDKGFCKDAKAQ
jgi:exopolyphosphatase/guanosine-5'-triphosphate,3'-diphosphate pyrophosphatase